MNWEHFRIALCPNLVVFIMASLASFTSLLYVFPQIISQSLYPSRVYCYVFYLISFIIFFMFLWCWIYTISSDPGRITDDLQQRGLLDEIKRGDIPFCLHKLPICEKCNIPMPPKSHHCNICHSCHLRYDHHCGVVGQCIADKNTKSFILSLLYSFLFAAITSIVCFYYAFKLNSHSFSDFDQSEILVFIVGFYCGILSLFLGSFSISMIFNEVVYLKDMNKKISFPNFVKLFGGRWYKMLTPLQEDSTCYAWPGIYWFDEFQL